MQKKLFEIRSFRDNIRDFRLEKWSKRIVPGVTFDGHVQFDLLTSVARRQGRNIFGVKIIQFTHNRGETGQGCARIQMTHARGPTWREDSAALRREEGGRLARGQFEQWPRSVDRYQSPSIGHECETNAIFSSSPPSSFLVFSFFFFFIFMSQEDEEHPVLVKDEGGGTWRISHDFLLSWLRDKKSSNHGICRFVGIFHWKKCPDNAISHGQGIFFLDSENSVTPCSPRDGWH